MLIQWSPFRDLNRLEREMNALFQGGNGHRAAQRESDAFRDVAWQPAVDVYEDAEKILLVADVPGVAQEAIEITVEKNVLTFKGVRPDARRGETKPGEAYQRVERVAGPFARSFTLPTTVDAERVVAELKHGVLTLTLPKKTEAQPRQIKVSVA